MFTVSISYSSTSYLWKFVGDDVVQRAISNKIIKKVLEWRNSTKEAKEAGFDACRQNGCPIQALQRTAKNLTFRLTSINVMFSFIIKYNFGSIKVQDPTPELKISHNFNLIYTLLTNSNEPLAQSSPSNHDTILK